VKLQVLQLAGHYTHPVLFVLIVPGNVYNEYPVKHEVQAVKLVVLQLTGGIN